MGHVFFRPGRLKLAAVLPIAIFWFAYAGGAHAALPSGGSINGITNPSTNWQGNFYGSATSSLLLPEPRDCPPQGGDPGSVTCDHFQLTTETSGQVRVVVTWPSTVCTTTVVDPCSASSDFDLLICDNNTPDPGEDLFLKGGGDRCTGALGSTSFEVAFSASNRPGFEDVSWPAVAGTTYEVRVLPSSIDIPGTDYHGCAEYTAASGAPFCQAPPPPPPPPAVDATFFTTGCAPDGNIQRQVDGAGKQPSVNPSSNDARFAIHVKRKVDKYGNLKLRGKVRYTDDNLVRFRSKNVGCATFNDLTKSVEVRGIGSTTPPNQQDPPVCYRAVATDNGDPGKGKDRFEIEIFDFNQTNNTCSGVASYANNGVITDGNIRYRSQPDQKDDQGEDN